MASSPQLAGLLQSIMIQVERVVSRPWFVMQRCPMPPSGTLANTPALALALRRYHVVLSQGELAMLWSAFPLSSSGDGFDWSRFVATLFPMESGQQVAPANRMRTTEIRQPTQTHPQKQTYAPNTTFQHPPSNSVDSWSRPQEELRAMRTTQGIFPPSESAPPQSVLARKTATGIVVPVPEQPNSLTASVQLDGKPIAARSQRLQRTQPPYQANSSSFGKSSSQSPLQSVVAPLPVAAPSRPRTRTAQQAGAASQPSYMLPVSRRSASRGSHLMSPATTSASSSERPNYGHSVDGRYLPYPDSIRRVNGESATATSWKPDTHLIPSVHYGQPNKF